MESKHAKMNDEITIANHLNPMYILVFGNCKIEVKKTTYTIYLKIHI